jgi:hypothetical protein
MTVEEYEKLPSQLNPTALAGSGRVFLESSGNSRLIAQP